MKRIYFMFAMLMALVFGATAQNQVHVTYEVDPTESALLISMPDQDTLVMGTIMEVDASDTLIFTAKPITLDYEFECWIREFYAEGNSLHSDTLNILDTLTLNLSELHSPYPSLDSIHIVARFTSPDNVADISSLTTFRIWPVPTTDRLYMEVQPKMVQVYNIQGQVLLTGNTKELNVSSLPAGTYTLRIVTQDGRVGTAKFIKY